MIKLFLVLKKVFSLLPFSIAKPVLKFLLKLTIKGVLMNWDSLIESALDLMLQIADGQIAGKDLSVDQKKAIQIAYGGIQIYGRDWVKKSKPTWDDELIERLETFAMDTAKEGEFMLPVMTAV